MINNLWSTPVLQTQMPDDLRGQLLNKIYMDYDLSNPPSDFNSTKILNDKSKEIVIDNEHFFSLICAPYKRKNKKSISLGNINDIKKIYGGR